MFLKKMKEELKAAAAQARLCKREEKARYRRHSWAQKNWPGWQSSRIDRQPYLEYIYRDENTTWKAWDGCVNPYNYRRKHIIYCLLRGRTYEQIEPKVHECNKLSKYDWEKINKAVEEGRHELAKEKALRDCAG